VGKTGSEGEQKERQDMTPRTAVLYARVSSREQREDGFSIEAQVKLLRAAATKEGFEIVREFIEVESAKAAGRKKFAEMVAFFKRNRTCRNLLVEILEAEITSFLGAESCQRNGARRGWRNGY
jgi:predicted site-specific integrase-resolvase